MKNGADEANRELRHKETLAAIRARPTREVLDAVDRIAEADAKKLVEYDNMKNKCSRLRKWLRRWNGIEHGLVETDDASGVAAVIPCRELRAALRGEDPPRRKR